MAADRINMEPPTPLAEPPNPETLNDNLVMLNGIAYRIERVGRVQWRDALQAYVQSERERITRELNETTQETITAMRVQVERERRQIHEDAQYNVPQELYRKPVIVYAGAVHEVHTRPWTCTYVIAAVATWLSKFNRITYGAAPIVDIASQCRELCCAWNAQNPKRELLLETLQYTYTLPESLRVPGTVQYIQPGDRIYIIYPEVNNTPHTYRPESDGMVARQCIGTYSVNEWIADENAMDTVNLNSIARQTFVANGRRYDICEMVDNAFTNALELDTTATQILETVKRACGVAPMPDIPQPDTAREWVAG